MSAERQNWSALAKRQREQWGIMSLASWKLPYYKEARRSVYKYRRAVYEKEFKKAKRQFPTNWSESMVINFIGRNNYALNEYQDEIFQAAKENNIDFFISLGALLKKQRAGKTSLNPNRFEPHDCISFTAYFWTEGLLWLMTDNAALEYFKLVLGKTFSLDAYRKAKSRLNVVEHPDLPVISVEKSELRHSTKDEVSSVNASPNVLKFELGWSLIDGVLRRG